MCIARPTYRGRVLTAALITFAALWMMTTPAAAHTGFESSSPADGEEVAEPVDEITLTFSGEATPTGEGFVVLDPAGTIRQPDAVSSGDNLIWTLSFDEPLAGGDVGVRWMVAAPDAHPIDGSFSFTVTAPAPLKESQDPATAAPEPAQDAVSAETAGPASDETEELDRVDAPVNPIDPTTDAISATELDSFLDTDEDGPAAASSLSALSRIGSIIGAILVIGGAAFAVFGLRGSSADVRAVLYWVRRGGALVALGASAEAVTQVVTLAGAWSGLIAPSQIGDALWSSAGIAIALRLVGGLLAASKTPLTTARATAVGDPVLAARQLATVGAGHASPPTIERADDEPFVYPRNHVWDHAVAITALVGVAMVAVSYAFDGHTASEGSRWLHALANTIHVITAATWAGGVVMLVYVIWRRHRRNQDTQALQLAMRFSVIATVALVGAALAGFALSLIVLDSITDIWSTPWGRLLALKVTLVAIAAAGGGYNHRIVVPALDRAPNDQATIDRFRTVITMEAVALVAVAVVTALLVGASAT